MHMGMLQLAEEYSTLSGTSSVLSRNLGKLEEPGGKECVKERRG